MTISVAPYAYFMGHDIGSYDVREALGMITAPTLVVAGDDERPTISEGSTYLVEHVAGAELAVMANCGHWPMLEAREAFFSVLLPFLS
jgi:pimeloyl-ACP methyl ester carboxylesterase